MTAPNAIKSLSLRGTRLLARLWALWVLLAVVGLGVLLGRSITSVEQGELVASIVIVIVMLLLSLTKPLIAVMLWIFFYPLFEQVIKIPLGAMLPDLSFSRFTIAFLVISMLAQGAIGKLRIRKIGLQEIMIVASAIGIALAAPKSLPSATGVFQTALALYFTPFVVYVFTKNLVKTRTDLKAIMWAIALLGTFSALYAAYEHATGNVLFLPRGRGALADLKLERVTLGIRLIVGLWGSAGTMGRVLATCIPPTLYLFLESRKTTKRRYLLAGMLASQGYSLLITMTRAPWLAAIVALFVLQFFDLRVRKLFIVVLIAGAILMPFVWDRVSESDVAARINDENSTYEGREARWQAGLNMWLAKPFRGWGFGRYELESWRFRTDGSTARLLAPENDYLEVMIGSGLLGLLPYLGVFLVPLWYGLRLFWQRRFYRLRNQPWPGFVKPEALGVAIAMIAAYLVYSFSAANVTAGTKLIILSLLGAVVGSHEHLLRRPRNGTRAIAGARQTTAGGVPPGDAHPSLATQRLNIRGHTS